VSSVEWRPQNIQKQTEETEKLASGPPRGNSSGEEYHSSSQL
jgi:hypothetical protein